MNAEMERESTANLWREAALVAGKDLRIEARARVGGRFVSISPYVPGQVNGAVAWCP